MTELSLDKPAGVLVKTTCVDFPGRVAGSFFLKGCNLRCPYCYNTNLVVPETPEDSPQLSTINDLFSHLEKRQGILTGLVISGGEPLLNRYTPLIIKKAKELGYKVKLDTNGTLPQELKKLLENKDLCPDFLAIDIKTTPQKYAELICPENSIYYKNTEYFEASLKESCHLASQLSPEQREFRTVLVPTLITKKDIPVLASYLPKDACWQFAQFQNKNCLDSSYNQLSPYTDSEIKEIIETAKNFIADSHLR